MADPKARSFRARAATRPRGGATIPIPFNPAEIWGHRDRYHVTGTIEEVRFRTTLVHKNGNWQMELAMKSRSSSGLHDGQVVRVEMWPEGPQLDELAPDIGQALAARPKAQSAFEALAQFYRKGWLRWIDGTKRRPEERARRIAEMVDLLESGQKERRS
ncbi:MAG TPA: YdeI/OmpD-associated family protein [Candidatus Dormibacteraeota bacterium]|nr:YdeI/OmpD-associated family protein [Candidatus Dormibacteraeota bacterium]